MGLNNPIVEEHMNALFGVERADELRDQMANISPPQRELLIVGPFQSSRIPSFFLTQIGQNS
jgi:hypothetical protein